MSITDAFRAFNAAVKRAANDYAIAPSRACHVEGCHNLRHDGARVCTRHDFETRRALQARREKRARGGS